MISAALSHKNRRHKARRITAIPLIALLALAGCTKGPEEASGAIELGRSIRALIAERRAGDPAPLQINRAFLQQFPQPHLEIIVENSDLTGYLGLVLARRDDLPGEITTWSAADNSALAFRNGMLIATRGLAGNLISASVPVQNGIAGPARGGQRRYHLRSGNNQEQVVTLACEITDLGSQRLEIYERLYSTRHLQEHCEGRAETGRKTVVLNDYWVDSQNQKVWKSRQWAGPEIGYLRIRDLSN
ncbi:YjbF family lipoprotein [Pseudophaeobacter sp.]|uniref:YjbF family lipoprotein n=1 Tax=Pseudophaeobacter sp. TaxID=1971739 RepID=UPI003299FAA5